MKENRTGTQMTNFEEQVFAFDELNTCPLIEGATYMGGNKGNYSDDPISKLLPVGNSGGFRAINNYLSTKFVVLFSTGNKEHWKDSLSTSDGIFTYFGDNDTPGRELLDTPHKGNAILERAFKQAAGDTKSKKQCPIFLLFQKSGTSRDVIFLGFALPATDIPDSLIVEVTNHPNGEIQNFVAKLRLLPPLNLDRNQLEQWIQNPQDSKFIPPIISDWADGYGLRVKSRFDAEQHRENPSTTSAISQSPIDFESSQAILPAELPQQLTKIEVLENHDDTQLNIRPDASMLGILENISYKEWFALGELIDNAISSYQAEFESSQDKSGFEQLEIIVKWDSSNKTITVSDNAGGIPLGPNGWERVFTLGRKKENADYLSVFGYGMKAAGLWWSPKIKIESTVRGEAVRRWAILDREEAQYSEQTALHTEPASITSHGTDVTLIGINKNRAIPTGQTSGRIRSYLASMYRVFLRGDDPKYQLPDGRPWLKIYVQNEELIAPEIELLSQPYWPTDHGPGTDEPIKYWHSGPLEFHINPSGIPQNNKIVRGWAGILEKGRPNDAGFLMLFRGKGVVGIGQSTKSNSDLYRPKQIVGAGNSNRRQRLVGEFDMTDFGKSITTDDMLWSEAEEAEFLKQLEAALKKTKIWSMAENWRPTRKNEMRIADVNTYEAAAEDAIISLRQDPLVEQPDPIPAQTTFNKSVDLIAPQAFEKEFVFEGKEYEFVGVLGTSNTPWLGVYPDGNKTSVQINLNHPFMQSFAYVPGHDPKGLFRLALVLAISEIESGEFAIRQKINHYLNGRPGSTIWEEVQDD